MNEDKRLRAARLAGKVALVTGAGPGLGGAISEAMADEGGRSGAPSTAAPAAPSKGWDQSSAR